MLNWYQEKLIQLDLEICALTSIAKRTINKKNNVSPKVIINEGLRLLNEIDMFHKEFHIQYLKVNN
jgi:hypothetical protein